MNSPVIETYSTFGYDKGYKNVDKMQVYGDRNEKSLKNDVRL